MPNKKSKACRNESDDSESSFDSKSSSSNRSSSSEKKTSKRTTKRKRRVRTEERVFCPFCMGRKIALHSLKRHIKDHHEDKFKGNEH